MNTPITKEALIERGFNNSHNKDNFVIHLGFRDDDEEIRLEVEYDNETYCVYYTMKWDDLSNGYMFIPLKNCTTMEQINTLIEICI